MDAPAGTKLIGIAGPSCAGKSELARWLSAHTGAPVLNLDHYYIDLSHLPLEVRARTNFDEAHSVDRDAIVEDARALAGGEAVHAPHYDFSTHTRAPGDDVIVPGPWVILEGLFTLWWPELRELLDVKLFVEAPNEVCLDRRIERDVRERGRTRESVIEQYARTVCPGAFQFIYPTKFHADLVLSGVDRLEHSGAKVLNYMQHG